MYNKNMRLGTLSPNIFEYENYRTFLKEVFAAFKSRNKKYSLRLFARIAGFQSHNTLWNVMEGRSNLSSRSISKISLALKLNKEEAVYFQNLVLLNQSKSSVEKAQYLEEIIRSRAYKKTHPLTESQLRYYTRWYYVVIREMVNLPQFKEDPQWVAENTAPTISAGEAKEALTELVKLGLLKRNEAGRLVQTNTIVATTNEVTSSLVTQFHREFMKRASESIDLINRANRDISSVTFRVSEQTAQRLKEKIQNFRKELTEEASRDAEPEAIYHLNLHLFPVTQFEKGGHKK